MANSWLTNVHTRKIITENVVFHNFYVTVCTIKKHVLIICSVAILAKTELRLKKPQ